MSIPSKGGGFDYMKVDKKTGEWLYGQEENIIEDDDRFAVENEKIG